MHLDLMVVDDFNVFQDAPHGGASQDGTTARQLFPGFEAEFAVLSGQLLAVMELYTQPDCEGHDVASLIRLPVGDEALFTQLPLVVSRDEWIIHIADIGQHGS